MDSKQMIKFSWRQAFCPLALGVGLFWGTEIPAQAVPRHTPYSPRNSYPVRTSGVRRVTPPVPLNLRPSHHISLPSSSPRYYDENYEYDRARRQRRKIRNSTLINPTIIDSDISDSVLVNPRIVNPSVQKQPTIRRIYYR